LVDFWKECPLTVDYISVNMKLVGRPGCWSRPERAFERCRFLGFQGKTGWSAISMLDDYRVCRIRTAALAQRAIVRDRGF
jgi:hypothetical protein